MSTYIHYPPNQWRDQFQNTSCINAESIQACTTQKRLNMFRDIFLNKTKYGQYVKDKWSFNHHFSFKYLFNVCFIVKYMFIQRCQRLQTKKPYKLKAGRNGFLHHFQQLGSYSDEIETCNQKEIPFSSQIVRRGL